MSLITFEFPSSSENVYIYKNTIVNIYLCQDYYTIASNDWYVLHWGLIKKAIDTCVGGKVIGVLQCVKLFPPIFSLLHSKLLQVFALVMSFVNLFGQNVN